MAKNQAKPDKGKESKEDKKQARRLRRRRRSGNDEGGFIILLFVSLLAIAPFSYQAALMLLVGLIPTIVMSLTDQKVMKSERLQCIALLNLSGVLPYAILVANETTRWPGILINEPLSFVPMWGAAAVGYIILSIAPMFSAIVLQAFAQDKLKKLAQQRQEFVDLWGPEVLGDTGKTETPKDNFIRPKKG